VNDRYDAGHAGHAGQTDGQYELVGYDEYGQPVYRQAPLQAGPQAYPPPPRQGGHEQQPQGYGYDPYAAGAGQQQPAGAGYGSHGSYESYDSYDSYGAGPGTGQQAPVPPAGAPYGGHRGGPPPGLREAPGGPGARPGPPPGPQEQHGQPAQHGQQEQLGQPAQHGQQAQPYDGPGAPPGRTGVAEHSARIPQQGAPGQAPRRDRQPGYDTEQFAFVEEQDGESEDVIDWLQFTENRTERREEAKRRARARMTAILVVLALVVVAGGGYLWYAGKLPFLSSSDTAQGTDVAAGAQKRDVIVVHLHSTKGSDTSTLLLVDNATTKKGSAVLLPNSLALTDQDGNTTTLGQSVGDDGSSGTRESLDTVLGTRIEGTWRLDTPFLQNLVDMVGHIEVDTDTDVPDPKDPDEGVLVHKGDQQTLSGRMATAYATYRGAGEPQSAQLQRFGQVMQGVLRKLSSDKEGATRTVQTLGQIIEPPLTDEDLGSFLAGLADRAKGGDYSSTVLPVEPDGTLGEKAGQEVVGKILGGQAKSPAEEGDGVRVSLRNATGGKTDGKKHPLADLARVALVNGGYTYVAAGTAGAAASSEVRYAEAGNKDDAVEVARTLGLPESSVAKGETAAGADVTVVLGQDYAPGS
jgi:anionic cell wall polymer biosynthesis LytR-Cps2A-Psr (LCP) family protein